MSFLVYNQVLCYGRGFEIPDTGYYRICQGVFQGYCSLVSRQISIRTMEYR